jgi:hypothetical protein
MLRDAVPDDDAALRSIFRRASLSNEGDRPLLLANPEHLVWREPTGSDAAECVSRSPQTASRRLPCPERTRGRGDSVGEPI